ncbi:hypothetical protein SPRG_00231 [Saprolegnia parasitica CBS 223.65]|uniref:PARP-type domain-containing protein n=1 Tax=Saprolegnia parasitica (strain CBS 223.65) TaxID=695850 RepID=A0A067D8P5_SAPPC|nr:hypothetical protein SPRG_00231 [Saprolegnia parasitica CBS 223.65]KDO35382.1 hypothetical protein SPRG_00231 [Saprolegnia parasitica CBS 223.65]|eukprot:XP_012193726.1 hypothetical protein SPRG_00231 [Saprolegnia parasitica CBS 223.65]
MPALNPWTRHATPILGRATASEIRVGVIFQHVKGYIALDWHHLTCCASPHLLPSVDGYELLTECEKDAIETYAKSTNVVVA